MDDPVIVERGGGVLRITLNRPEARNAITVAMYAVLADAIAGAADDPDVRCIAIRGNGPDFAAGNDLADFLAAGTRNLEELAVWRLLRALGACRIPLVAAVHGNCVGIGTTMLMHCDLVIAADSAKFSLPFVDLGLVPEAASSLLMPQFAGRRRAARYLLLGESFGADEALDIGLASHRCADDSLGDMLDKIVSRLIAKPAEALRETQRLLRADPSDSVDARMRLESAAFSERLQSEEVKTAIAAFFAARAKR